MNEHADRGSTNFLVRYLSSCRNTTERDRRNASRANAWLLAWMVSFFLATFGIKLEILPAGLLTYLAIAVSSLLGLVSVIAFTRFLREADELQRKIQLEALALGFGGGFLATFTLSLVERAADTRMDLGDPFLAMVVLYVVGILLGARRYA